MPASSRHLPRTREANSGSKDPDASVECAVTRRSWWPAPAAVARFAFRAARLAAPMAAISTSGTLADEPGSYVLQS